MPSAQPPTLAAFLPWGDSEGAARTSLTGTKVQVIFVLPNNRAKKCEFSFDGLRQKSDNQTNTINKML